MPRNNPSFGSSVLHLLRLNSLAHTEVLVCVSTPRGVYHLTLRNNTFVPVDRTCALIMLMDPDPVWAIEEMPLERVMGDMALLSTGDVLIVNGVTGHQGV